MDTRRFDALGKVLTGGLSRRTALRRLTAGGITAAALGAVGLQRRATAQEAPGLFDPRGARHAGDVVFGDARAFPANGSRLTSYGANAGKSSNFFTRFAPASAT